MCTLFLLKHAIGVKLAVLYTLFCTVSPYTAPRPENKSVTMLTGHVHTSTTSEARGPCVHVSVCERRRVCEEVKATRRACVCVCVSLAQ